MAEETMPVSKFKATCLAVLDKVKRTGQPLIITRRGEPLAMVAPPPQPRRSASWLGAFASSGKIVGDIVSPAQPEETWEVFDR